MTGAPNPSDRGGSAEAARPRLSDHAFERLLEAHADGELSPKARRVLEAELANSPQRRAQFERSERLVIAMAEPIAYPDLSESILSRLESRGVIVPAPKRRRLTAGRWAAAAAIALTCGGLVLIERHAPGSTPIASNAPAPVSSVVSSVVEASKSGVNSSVNQMRQAVNTISNGMLPAPATAQSHVKFASASETPKSLGLKLGGTSAKYDAGSKWTVATPVVTTAMLPTRQESALSAILSPPDEQGLWLGIELRGNYSVGIFAPRPDFAHFEAGKLDAARFDAAKFDAARPAPAPGQHR